MDRLSRFTSAVFRLTRLGVTEATDPRTAKRIILTNQFALSFGFLPLPFLLLDRGPVLKVVDIVISSLYFSILVLNGYGHSKAGRMLFLVLSLTGVFACNLMFGNDKLIWVLFFPTICYPILLFGWEEKTPTLSVAGLSAVLLLLSELYFAYGGQPLKDVGPFPAVYRPIMLAVTVGVFILSVFYALRAGGRAEIALSGALEAAKAADKAKSRFLANMSHEIRTPLNGILGLADILAKRRLTASEAESVDAIRSSAQDLLGIINDILDLSKIEAGKLRLESIPFEVRKLREGLWQLFEPLSARKGLDLRMDVDPRIPSRLIGDPVRIKQILTNLIGNAIKFTQRGSVQLRMSMEGPAVENIVRMRFEVEDTGVGIPKESQGRLFNAFSQGDDSTTRKFGGTGLGLHLCRQMSEMMGGSIGFRSQEGEGSLFHFTVPLAAAPGEAPPEPDGADAGGRLPEGLRILIVDDHPVNRRVLEGMLELRGCRPQKAADGVEALEAVAREGTFDLILMDSHMPRMDGFECTRRLRAAGSARRPVIIGFTADAMEGSREKCLEAGMDDMITKPILERDLNRALTRWVGESAAPEAAPIGAHDGDWVDPGQIHEMNAWISHYEPGYWEKTLGQFDESFRKLTGEMRAACEAGDFHTAGEAAHSLKGISLMLGMRRMADICQGLEAMGMGGDTGAWKGLLTTLEEARGPSLREMRKLTT